MKKIVSIFVLAVLVLSSQAQNDSAKLKPTITIQARECEVALFFSQDRKNLQDLDSVLITKWRPPATAPTGTTNVVVDSVEAKAWFNLLEKFATIPSIIQEGSFGRLATALINGGHSWLTTKVTKLLTDVTTSWTNIRQDGRQYGKKEKTY